MSSRGSFLGVVAAVAIFLQADALNNGLGLTPQMGYSSWNDCSSDVTEAHLRNITAFLISSGLAAKGYTRVNVDEGWLKGRLPNGTIYHDAVKFPSGMKGFGDWVHSQSYAPGKYMLYGLYTSRGTCQCSTNTYQGPGSQGYEVLDAEYFAWAGADYLKEDSCCGSQDYDTAFADYARMRDALNATGRPIFFSLCGWNSWYAPVGYTLGNSWRIAGDGSGWGPLTNCINVMSGITQFTGPGGWNDPDLLIGPNVQVGGQTDQQARSQFTMWCVLPGPLLISNNLLETSNYTLETYGNEEAIAVNQDPAGKAGIRLAGVDLTYPCQGGLPAGALFALQALPCDTSDPLQQFVYNQTDSTIRLATYQAADAVLDFWQCDTDDGTLVYVYPNDNGGGTCSGKNQQWQLDSQGRFINPYSGKCLDVYDFKGPSVDLWTCNGGANQQFKVMPDGTIQSAQPGLGLCLAAVPADAMQCTNVWGRPLYDGSWAMAMINNAATATNVTCDASCWAPTGISAKSLTVRDLWAHADVGVITNNGTGFSFTATVPGDGGSVLYKFTPAP